MPILGQPPRKLNAADLAELPETLRNALEQALVRIGSEAVSGAIEAIRPHSLPGGCLGSGG
jgi:hypothetical protein